MKRRAPILMLCLCAVVFVLGVIQLFKLRFDQGDVYPPYSSLRADPLGAMALYESLQRTPGIKVWRDYSARNKLPESQNTTYLHLAADPQDWHWMPDTLVAEIDAFLSRGGRLVIACEPEMSGSFFLSRSRSSPDTNSPAARERKGEKMTPKKPVKPGQPAGDEEEVDPLLKLTDIRQHWGFDVNYEELQRGLAGEAEAVTVTNLSSLPMPASLDWHSATLFTGLATNWQVIYSRGTNAVIMERRFGRGTVVFAGDSFFVSNEALMRDRHVDLLAWLIGPSRIVVFDEAHLGVIEEPGVTTLMRRYRFHGVVAGLALLMGLFVWKNSFSLVPPPKAVEGQNYVAGRDSSAGFVNLLRRAIPGGDILKVCFEQWEKSIPGRRDLTASRIEQARQIVADELARTGRDRNPVAAYQQVSKVLKTGVNSAKPVKEVAQ